MKRYATDIAGLAGVSLIGAGAWLEFGAAWSMMACGSLVLVGAVLTARSAQ